MAHDAVCKDKKTALKILETVAETMKDGVQKTALKMVYAFIQKYVMDLPDDPKERKALAEQLRRNICQNCEGYGQTAASASGGAIACMEKRRAGTVRPKKT